MRLLVSVTQASEVPAALAGADIVDVKDPLAGALGPPSPAVVRAVRLAVAGRRPTSVALGDAYRPIAALLADAGLAASCGASFVKLALPDGRRAWREALRRLVEAMREAGGETRVVAVAYADSGSTGREWPLELPALAAEAGARAVMLDTARKDGTSLLDHLQESELARFLEDCRGVGALAGLAGSLGAGEVRRLAPLAPDVIGVRGAACRGGRAGPVDPARVRRLARLIRRHRGPSGTTTSAVTPAGSAAAK